MALCQASTGHPVLTTLGPALLAQWGDIHTIRQRRPRVATARDGGTDRGVRIVVIVVAQRRGQIQTRGYQGRLPGGRQQRAVA